MQRHPLHQSSTQSPRRSEPSAPSKSVFGYASSRTLFDSPFHQPILRLVRYDPVHCSGSHLLDISITPVCVHSESMKVPAGQTISRFTSGSGALDGYVLALKVHTLHVFICIRDVLIVARCLTCFGVGGHQGRTLKNFHITYGTSQLMKMTVRIVNMQLSYFGDGDWITLPLN
jgi:hypothetical protein